MRLSRKSFAGSSLLANFLLLFLMSFACLQTFPAEPSGPELAEDTDVLQIR